MIKIKGFVFFLFKALGLNSFLHKGSLQYILRSHFKGISLPPVDNSNYQVVLNCKFGIGYYEMVVAVHRYSQNLHLIA